MSLIAGALRSLLSATRLLAPRCDRGSEPSIVVDRRAPGEHAREARPHHARGRRHQDHRDQEDQHHQARPAADDRRQQCSARCSRERRACSCPSSRRATQFNMSYRGLGNPQEARICPGLAGRHADLDRLDRLSDALLHAASAIAGGSAADPRRLEPDLRARTRAGGQPRVEAARRPTSRSAATRKTSSAATGSSRRYNTVEGSSGPVSVRGNFGYVRNNGQRDNGRVARPPGRCLSGVPPDEGQPVVPRLPPP